MSLDTQFKASDSVSEVSHSQQNTPNFNVLDLMKGAQPGSNDSAGTAKDYLPSMSLTGDDGKAYGGPLIAGRDGQPIGQTQDVNSLPSMREPFEPVGKPIQPLGQPIEHPSVIGKASPPVPIEHPSVIGKASPPSVIGTASPPMPIEQPIRDGNPMAPYLM